MPSLSQHIFDLIYSIFEEGAIELFKSAANSSYEELGRRIRLCSICFYIFSE